MCVYSLHVSCVDRLSVFLCIHAYYACALCLNMYLCVRLCVHVCTHTFNFTLVGVHVLPTRELSH